MKLYLYSPYVACLREQGHLYLFFLPVISSQNQALVDHFATVTQYNNISVAFVNMGLRNGARFVRERRGTSLRHSQRDWRPLRLRCYILACRCLHCFAFRYTSSLSSVTSLSLTFGNYNDQHNYSSICIKGRRRPTALETVT
jgi:hypothetical protein